jgi:hypothetical protein
MTPQQRVLIASAISAIVMVFYVQLIGLQESPPRTVSPEQAQQAMPKKFPDDFIQQLEQKEELITIESNQLLLKLRKSAPVVQSIVLKDFRNMETNTPIEVGKSSPVVVLELDQVDWVSAEHTDTMAVWRGAIDHGQEEPTLSVMVGVDESKPVFRIELHDTNKSDTEQTLQARLFVAWERSDGLSGRQNPL